MNQSMFVTASVIDAEFIGQQFEETVESFDMDKFLIHVLPRVKMGEE